LSSGGLVVFKRKKDIGIDMKNLPNHVAIIPDGNGRWARKRGLPRSIGHREGANVIEKMMEHAGNIGIKYLSIYAFSTENWKREKSEVDYIMDLLKEFLDSAEKKIRSRNIRIKIIGSRENLDEDLKKSIVNIEKKTENNDKLLLIIALNYGGRKEITDCIQRIMSENKNKDIEITEDLVSDYLYTKDIPDPDLLIRTSGEFRSSNFYIWQMAYTEYYFTEVLWPSFSKDDFNKAILEYQKRKRRYGGRK